ncbi:hypothetical protein [Neisseria bacilliformis]|nr:hypothetical protein [Neisseria bacilliformis]
MKEADCTGKGSLKKAQRPSETLFYGFSDGLTQTESIAAAR